MAGKLELQVLTPVQTVLNRPVDFVILRCETGDKGIMPGHESFLGRLQSGMLRVYEGGEMTENFFVMGGTAVVDKNRVTILTEMAGGVKEVTLALEKIEEQLELRRKDELRSDVEIHRAEVALRNALVHMDVSSYTVLSSRKESRGQ